MKYVTGFFPEPGNLPIPNNLARGYNYGIYTLSSNFVLLAGMELFKKIRFHIVIALCIIACISLSGCAVSLQTGQSEPAVTEVSEWSGNLSYEKRETVRFEHIIKIPKETSFDYTDSPSAPPEYSDTIMNKIICG